jgi:hypothetical protein
LTAGIRVGIPTKQPPIFTFCGNPPPPPPQGVSFAWIWSGVGMPSYRSYQYLFKVPYRNILPVAGISIP